MPIKFVFLILPEVHLLDLAGPDQVIAEAIDFGADFCIEYAGIQTDILSSAGLGITHLKHFSEIEYKKDDFIIIPGSRVKYIFSEAFKSNLQLFKWLSDVHRNKVNLVSICVGAFVLAEAGILQNVACTTHFQLTQKLQERFPFIKVQENTLYVSEGNIHTSAGIASGIDLMLHLVEQITDGFFAHKVARELVVYNRRNGIDQQINPHFHFRNHIHSGIHHVQDYIVNQLSQKHTIKQLAELAHMSERNFTRIFKKEIGITVHEYIQILRLEKIKVLMKNPDFSKKQIAKELGLSSEKQLDRLLK